MTKNSEKPAKKPANKPKSQKTSKPKKEVASPVENINVQEEFPHSGFPYKLIHNEDNKKITCYFMNENHLNTHIERYRLDKRKIKVLCRYDYEESK